MSGSPQRLIFYLTFPNDSWIRKSLMGIAITQIFKFDYGEHLLDAKLGPAHDDGEIDAEV